MSMDRRTDEEKRETMLADRQRRQAAALVLLNELHDAGFSGVWIDSTQIGGDGHYYAKVIIDDEDLSHDRMTTIMAVAEVHDAKVMLDEVRMNQQSFSRIGMWPFAEGDD
jgi:hypothetical protein